MSEIQRILDQLKHSVDGDAWHGPALAELLSDVKAAQAAARPLPQAHTIWEITLHTTVWMEQIRLRLIGKGRKDLPPEEDWPQQPARTDEASWNAILERLHRAHKELAAEIERVDETRLDQPIMAGFSTVYVSLHGVIQHNLYHAGQIALLKRVL
jgi:uncharacterized damage-inducible protein DinB